VKNIFCKEACESDSNVSAIYFAKICEDRKKCESDRHFAYPLLLLSLVLWNCQVWRFGPPGAAGLSAQRGHILFGLKEGCARCTTSRVGLGMQRQEKTRKTLASASAVPECNSVSATDTLPILSPPFPSAMELLGAALWPTWRGWTFCPARAHPFWIKRGVRLLHDLVSRLGSEDKKDKKNQNKHLQVCASAVPECDSVSAKDTLPTLSLPLP
jgi:hypothetical protein